MHFELRFEMNNAAFDNDYTIQVERILKELSGKIYNGIISDYIFDWNGNKIGEWNIIE